MLPMVMAVACELHVPIHKGPHSGGWAFDMDLAYPGAVAQLLEGVAQAVADGLYCADVSKLTSELDQMSRTILEKLAKGQWTLTSDGLDYLPGGRGCSGVSSIVGKPSHACPQSRRHGIRHLSTNQPLARRALEVGE